MQAPRSRYPTPTPEDFGGTRKRPGLAKRKQPNSRTSLQGIETDRCPHANAEAQGGRYCPQNREKRLSVDYTLQ